MDFATIQKGSGSSSSRKGLDDDLSSENARYGSLSSNNSAFNESQEAPSTAQSIGSELSSFFRYIAITAGGKSVENNNFRPGNLPPKSQKEIQQTQELVEKDRREYMQKRKEKQRMLEQKRII